MSKIKYLLLLLFMPCVVFAMPDATISTSASIIESGEKVSATVTLTDTAAWNIRITGSGQANCSSKYADVTEDGKSTTKSFNLECSSIGSGEITFNVIGDITSGSGETKDISLTKSVTVKEPSSSINTLSDLKVDGLTVGGFSSSKISYTLDNISSDSINITATPTDSKASVSGLGKKNLVFGKNTFEIIVKAENGSKKTYLIIVNKPDTRSSNNYLKILSIDKGQIDFDKNKTNYSITLEHNIDEINIIAESEDIKSKVSGTGKKILKDSSNSFNIIVTAENGSTRTYTLNIIRKKEEIDSEKLSSDNSVKSITVSNYEINFNENAKSYDIIVENDVNSIEVNVIPNDSKASISITGNNILNVGTNRVSIKITAEDGQINEYIINVYKKAEEKSITKDQNSNATTQNKNTLNSLKLIILIILFLIDVGLIIIIVKKKKNNN